MPTCDKPAVYLLKKKTFDQILDIIIGSTTYEKKGEYIEVRVHRDESGQIESLLETFCKNDT